MKKEMSRRTKSHAIMQTIPSTDTRIKYCSSSHRQLQRRGKSRRMRSANLSTMQLYMHPTRQALVHGNIRMNFLIQRNTSGYNKEDAVALEEVQASSNS